MENKSKAFVFLADGFEEVEALATVDILRRGGVEVFTVSVPEGPAVKGSHGIGVLADMELAHFVKDFVPGQSGAMIFPGGLPGAANLASNRGLMDLLRAHFAQKGIVAAICAAPSVVLPALGAELKGYEYTCYGGDDAGLNALGASFVGGPAVVSRNLVTGRGPGCALHFALEALEILSGKETAAKVKAGLLMP